MKKIALLVLLLSVSVNLHAQSDTSKVFCVTLNDDSEYTGYIFAETDSLLTLKTFGGSEIKILKHSIIERTIFEGAWLNGKYVRRDPNTTRLLFAPTGKTLKAGSGYFSAYELFLPFISVGVTDQITLSGGVSLIPGAETQAVYFAPKIGIVQDKNSGISAGLLFITAEGYNLGVVYGVGTYGNETASGTIGIGYGFADGDFAKSPLIVLGGDLQLSNSIKIITENWILPEFEGALISFGIRFFGERLAADFGLFTSTKAGGNFPFAPWLGFTYNF